MIAVFHRNFLQFPGSHFRSIALPADRVHACTADKGSVEIIQTKHILRHRSLTHVIFRIEISTDDDDLCNRIVQPLYNQLVMRHDFDGTALQIVNHGNDTGSSIQKDTFTILNKLTGTAADSGFSVKIDQHTILHQQLSGFRQNLIQAFSDSTAVHSSHLSFLLQLHQIASNRGLTDVKLLCDIPYMDGSFSFHLLQQI